MQAGWASTLICGAATGAAIIGGAATIGAATGAVMATGVAHTGAAIAVPHGEPLWNQFRQRPQQQPEVEAASAATASRIVNFLMIRFSDGGRTWASVRDGEGCASSHEGQDGRVKQLYPTPHDVQTQQMIFFRRDSPHRR
jgi:hypothetical protein